MYNYHILYVLIIQGKMSEEKNIGYYFISKNELDIQKIIDNYANYVIAIVKNFQTIKIEDEEEIISDVFFIVWKNKERLDKNAKFSPYIAGITKKVIYKKMNMSKIFYDEFNENVVGNFNVEKLLEEKELNDCIINNLKAIGEEEYLIFSKFYYDDKKIKDIAKELGISSSKVKTTLHRTRKKVKEFLKMGGFC